MKLCAYLNDGGDCRQAFNFYAEHLGGKSTMPMADVTAPRARASAAGASARRRPDRVRRGHERVEVIAAANEPTGEPASLRD